MEPQTQADAPTMAEAERIQEARDIAVQRWATLKRQLNADGLAVWFFAGKQTIYLRHQDGFPARQLQRELEVWQQHGHLLIDVARDGKPRIVEPGWKSETAANPTSQQVLLAAAHVHGSQFAIVEVLRDPVAVHDAEELDELVDAARLAADQERVRQLRKLHSERKLLHRRDQFAIGTHRSLDPQRVAFHVANAGRNLIECDRMIVALRHRRRMRVGAISGQTEINRRSNQIRLVELLIRKVVESGQAVVFGSTVSEVPESVSAPLSAYIADSGARCLIVVPLKWSGSKKTHGALVIENFESDVLTERTVADAEFVAGHATVALRNSNEYTSVFLHSARRRVGRALTAAHWLRRMALLLLFIAVVTALCLIPLELRIEGTGTLRPVERRGVFAPENGTVVEMTVDNGDPVTAGQPLAVLYNAEIAVWQDHLEQELANAEKSMRIREAERADRSISRDRRIQLDGEIVQFREQVQSFQRQLALVEDRIEELTLKAPIDGVIATWDTDRQLLNRTVSQGELLLLVNDESRTWQIDIQVPESESDDVLKTWCDRTADSQRVPVDYILATHPERRYRGWLTAVENRAETLSDEQVVFMTVVPDEDDMPPLRDGAEVRAKIRCGSRPIGYVWFRDVFRFVQGRILF